MYRYVTTPNCSSIFSNLTVFCLQLCFIRTCYKPRQFNGNLTFDGAHVSLFPSMKCSSLSHYYNLTSWSNCNINIFSTFYSFTRYGVATKVREITIYYSLRRRRSYRGPARWIEGTKSKGSLSRPPLLRNTFYHLYY